MSFPQAILIGLCFSILGAGLIAFAEGFQGMLP